MSASFGPIATWSEAADLVTIISLPVGFLAIVVAGLQIRHQLADSRRRTSFDAFLQFSDRFHELMRLRSDLKDRFDRDDKSLRMREIEQYYQSYWNIQINEWELFRSGFLPIEIYASWLCYTHDSIVGEFHMGYFDDRGRRKSLTAADAFTGIALNQMMRSQTECREFFLRLSEIPQRWLPVHSADPEVAANLRARFSRIKALLAAEGRVYRKTRAWKLA